MNLLLLEPQEISPDGTARLTDGRAAHVLRVLKAGPGDRLRVGVIDGPVGAATILAAGAGQVDLRCEFGAVPPRPAVDLLLALPRPKVLRRLWAQLAALGVGRIVLTNAARVERNYFDTHVLAEPAYRPLLIEGLQQARDTRLPRVLVCRRLKVFVEDELDSLAPAGPRLVAHPGSHPSIPDALRASGAARVLLAIGPEGGWTPYELALLEGHGFGPVSAGSRPLRSDTAAVALVALAHDGLSSRRASAGPLHTDPHV